MRNGKTSANTTNAVFHHSCPVLHHGWNWVTVVKLRRHILPVNEHWREFFCKRLECFSCAAKQSRSSASCKPYPRVWQLNNFRANTPRYNWDRVWLVYVHGFRNTSRSHTMHWVNPTFLSVVKNSRENKLERNDFEVNTFTMDRIKVRHRHKISFVVFVYCWMAEIHHNRRLEMSFPGCRLAVHEQRFVHPLNTPPNPPRPSGLMTSYDFLTDPSKTNRKSP